MPGRLRENAGFTLIELMIVVVIIGLLVALAIPNFMSYQARSRQTEAKAGLGGIYTNEQAYFSEKSYYSPNMDEIGFGLAGKAKYYDFTVSAPVSYSLTDPKSITFMSGSWIGKNGTPGDGPDGGDLGFTSAEDLPGADNVSFTAIAAGNVDTDPTIDTWVITHIGWVGNMNPDPQF